MRLNILIKTLPLILAFMICTDAVFSQVTVERSKDKAIISGVPYFIHQVKKGETTYSISKAYGITVEDLDRENPPAVYGIKEGQTLRIPVKLVGDPLPAVAEPVKRIHDDTKFIYHALKPGETVYSLSKSFGVSEDEIIQCNSGMDINKLSIGTEIAIPKREFMNNQQNFNNQDSKYIYHKVLLGESLSDIAKQYGLSVRQLRKENRDLRFPQVGDFVRIPGAKIAEIQVPDQVIADTFAVVEAVKPVKIERSGYSPVRDLTGSLDVAVLLPFYLAENSSRTDVDSSKFVKGKRIYKVNQMSDDWIYPGSIDFLEIKS
jgi:LysM repeat protein